MDREQIQTLIDRQAFPDPEPAGAELIETHISYVILGPNRVYKIKKPFQYSFLDFSTLAQRKHYCEEELRLNRRLAAAMYRQVLPVYADEGGPMILSAEDPIPPKAAIIDYTLEMQRMDSRLEMDKMLANNAVRESDIEKIADKVARFHEQTKPVYKGVNPEKVKAKFRDIASIEGFLGTHLPAYKEQVTHALAISDHLIDNLGPYLRERHDAGLVRDCHGDLHSKNIFLYDDPVIFDCIEFNEDFRHIDILNEVAFFCMDLEANGAWQLSKHFYNRYQPALGNQPKADEKSDALFTYFKAYRANVRGKVIALKLLDQQKPDNEAFKAGLDQISNYLDLMNGYLSALPEHLT